MKRIETPDLRDFLLKRKDEIKSEINCVSIGTINSFDADTQTVDVTINYKRIIRGETPRTVSYPILVNCPVIILNGGGAYLTFPIDTGDTCIVLFCDRDMDNWVEYGNTDSAPNTDRAHDLSDGIALVGVFSKKNNLETYAADKVKLAFGESYITIDNNGLITLSGSNITVDSENDLDLTGKDITISGDSVSIYDDYEDRTSNYGPQLADTDGTVVASMSCATGNACLLVGYTDATSTPTTAIAKLGINGDNSHLYMDSVGSLTMPVKKGNYWQLIKTAIAGSTSSFQVKWIPKKNAGV
jgi:hypothetical protein